MIGYWAHIYIYTQSFTNLRSYLNHLKRIFMYVTDLTCSFFPVWYLNFRGFAGQFTGEIVGAAIHEIHEIVARWARDPRDDMGGHGSHDTTHGLLLLLLFFAYFVHVLHNVNRFARMDRISFMSEVSTYTRWICSHSQPFLPHGCDSFGQVHPSSHQNLVFLSTTAIWGSFFPIQRSRRTGFLQVSAEVKNLNMVSFSSVPICWTSCSTGQGQVGRFTGFTVAVWGLGESQEAKHELFAI